MAVLPPRKENEFLPRYPQCLARAGSDVTRKRKWTLRAPRSSGRGSRSGSRPSTWRCRTPPSCAEEVSEFSSFPENSEASKLSRDTGSLTRRWGRSLTGSTPWSSER